MTKTALVALWHFDCLLAPTKAQRESKQQRYASRLDQSNRQISTVIAPSAHRCDSIITTGDTVRNA